MDGANVWWSPRRERNLRSSTEGSLRLFAGPQLRFRDLSYDCGCVPMIEVINARILADTDLSTS
jgi:hypothetical protein